MTKVIKDVVKTMDSGKKGNLTAKTFYKTRKDASQRVMDIDKSLLPTSETYFSAILSDANIPQIFENPAISDDILGEEGVIYRDGDPETHEREIARWRYEERVKSGWYQIKKREKFSLFFCCLGRIQNYIRL